MTDTAGPQFILSGDRDGTSPLLQGTHGYYFSSSAWTGATYAYLLYLYGPNSAVYPASRDVKRIGLSLRCLAQ